MKVNILMATYNGATYLTEQIESIQRQTFQDWQLLIRDDGSTDGTLEVIRGFEAADTRIHLINPDKQVNIGVIKSFFTLLKADQADYYFFCDQDDVWLEDKLAVTLRKAQEEACDLPILVYTDLSVVTDKLEVIHQSMIKAQSHHANTKLLQELTENTVTGGTMMVNHALAELWVNPEHLLMHDWYLALIAAAKGRLLYLDRVTELYRQHQSNVLGARTWKKRLKNWLNPHKLVAKYWWLITESQKQAKQLLSLDLSPDNRALVEAYVGLLDLTILDRLRTLKTYGFAKNRFFHTVVFRTLIITKFGYRR